METLTPAQTDLRGLRLQAGLTAKELAAKISQFLGEDEARGPMTVIMMERRGRMSNANVRDALEHIYNQYGISADQVRSACRK